MHLDKLPIRHSFVVRIWQETDRPVWQGLVYHVASGELAPVRELVDVQRFIEQHIGAQDAGERDVDWRTGLR
ncbi:MAG: hypothetical protein P8129_19025 [Anaerolineae bacterium]|jgi:hypothetical protein